jgi:hypothetical protein
MGTLLRSSLGLDCEEKDGRPWTVVLVFFQDGLMEFLKRGSLNSGSQTQIFEIYSLLFY